MARRILIELALFLTPFLIFYLFRAASKDMSVKDRWPMTVLVMSGGVLAVGALIIAALMEPSTRGKCFQPFYMENGVRMGGDTRPCDEVYIPKSEGATSAARDEQGLPSSQVDPSQPDGGESVD